MVDPPASRLTVRARALAWLSYLCLFTAGVIAVVGIWLPVMWVAIAFASLGLVLIVAALILLLAERRAPRR